MNTYTEAVILGMIAGFLARLYMLRTDYRNYPSYPHGYIIHLSLRPAWPLLRYRLCWRKNILRLHFWCYVPSSFGISGIWSGKL